MTEQMGALTQISMLLSRQPKRCPLGKGRRVYTKPRFAPVAGGHFARDYRRHSEI